MFSVTSSPWFSSAAGRLLSPSVLWAPAAAASSTRFFASAAASSPAAPARRRPKLSMVGAGNIGATLSLLAAQRNLGDTVLFDIAKGVPQGKALDLFQAMAPLSIDSWHTGSTDLSAIEGSDVVIVTAGFPRKDGMSRDDLLNANSKVISSIADGIAQHCPSAFVIVITNPLDAMVHLMQQRTKLPHSRVVGMAGVLDASRFRTFLAQRLGVSVNDVQAIVMGGHGDTMVAVKSSVSVGGLRLKELLKMGMITDKEIDEIVARTAQGGGEIVKLLGTSAFYAPAASAIDMAEAFLRDTKRVMPCAAHLNGEYGVKGLYVGVPCVIGGNGVERVLEIELTTDEQQAFAKSVASVRELVGALPKQ